MPNRKTTSDTSPRTAAEVEAELDLAISELAETLLPIVAHIEGRPETTKNRYDKYMGAITLIGQKMTDDDTMVGTAQRFVALAMIEAGGNKTGIKDACMVMGITI
jgi:hypothetical protein